MTWKKRRVYLCMKAIFFQDIKVPLTVYNGTCGYITEVLERTRSLATSRVENKIDIGYTSARARPRAPARIYCLRVARYRCTYTSRYSCSVRLPGFL